MILKEVVSIINNILDRDRQMLKITGGGHFIVEEHREDIDGIVNSLIVFDFAKDNEKSNVARFRYKWPSTDDYKDKLEEFRCEALEHFMCILKYGKQELDYAKFVSSTYSGHNQYLH